MTTKALLRTSTWDWDQARDNLRSRASVATASADGHMIRITPEPLLRRHSSGGLQQSVRIDGAGGVPRIIVRTASGSRLPAELRRDGQILRAFLPEPARREQLSIELPDVLPGRSLRFQLDPPRHWDIHLIHHSHLDIGYTDPQGIVVAQHLSYLDSVLELIRQTDSWDDDAQFRWVVESLWAFDQWSRNRPAATVQAFLERVREGRIELTALPFNVHTEACSTDELHELTRLARELRSRCGIGTVTAMQTDVPGAVGGLVDVLAEEGIRYLSVAHNWAGRSSPHLTGGQDLPRLFRWRSTAGGEVLVWMTDTPHGLAYMEGSILGFDVSYDMVEDLLPAYLTALASRPYPLDGSVFGFLAADVPLHRKPYPWEILHLRIQGHFGDNAPPRRLISETVRDWNERWAFPRLRLSRNLDFFQEAERRYGAQLETFTGDWNDWWADGIGAGARPLQLARRAQNTLTDALTVSSLAGLRGAAGAASDTEASRPVYLDAALFDEHTWGAADPWTRGDDQRDSGEQQWHWKYHTAQAAHDNAATLRGRALARFATTLPASDTLASVYVINTSAASRSGLVEIFIPESRVPLSVALSVMDPRAEKLVAVEQRSQVNPEHREAGRFLTIAAEDVPALGILRFDLIPAGSPAPAPESFSPPTVLENDTLRVEVDLATASIISIVHKPTGTELVSADATFGFNAYIYDHYASAGGINHQSSKLEASGNLALIGSRALARPAAIVDSGRNGVRQWLVYETIAPGADAVRTTLVLPVVGDLLHIENRISKAATMAKESAYYAFPFALPEVTVRFESSASVTGDDVACVPGGARHMRAMRHWAALHSGDLAVAWVTADSALVQHGSIAVPYVPFPHSTPSVEPATLYAWVHNNLWDTNFPSQQAFEMSFRYAVGVTRAANADEASAYASRCATDVVRPLAAVLAPASQSAQTLTDTPAITLGDERIQLVGLTTPGEGQLLVRLRSVAGTSVRCPIRCTPQPSRLWRASFLGEAREALAWADGESSIEVGAFGTAAVLFEFAAR